MRLVLRALLWAALGASAGACSEVPKEAVTLSVTVGQDLEVLHRSHLAMADAYFARMKRDVDVFMNDVYRPKLLEEYFRDTNYPVNDLGLFEPEEGKIVGRLPLIDIIANEIKQPGTGETIGIMTIAVEEAMSQIELRRRKLMLPLETQEQEVKRAITDVYIKVIHGHAVVTAHLASVRKVQEAQDEFLADLGLADVRSRFIDTTVKVSEKVSELLSTAASTRDTVEGLDQALDDLEGQIESWETILEGS